MCYYRCIKRRDGVLNKMRKIIHIDMDAFYAQVEVRENPLLRGKPVIVGGNPDARGVVATCSYEARKFGIHSAMPARTARQLCPEAIFIKPRYDVYKEVSRQMGEIFRRYTDQVEFLALDEAFLDVTENKKAISSATAIAKAIKKDIYEALHLTGSAGVSYNKFLAKVASDYRKPNGLTVITPEKAQKFLDDLPINKFFLVGKVTEKELRRIGVHYGRDLRKLELEYLVSIFKKRGYMLYDFARGIDERKVENARVRKSIGAENTLYEDIELISLEAEEIFKKLAQEVSIRVKTRKVWGKHITIKIKFSDFTQITRSMTIPYPIAEGDEIMTYVHMLVSKVEEPKQKVRLLGITLAQFVDTPEEEGENISLFEYLDTL